MKNRITLAILALCFWTTGALAQTTPAYHANVLGVADGRTNLQIASPSGLNRWGQVIGTYSGVSGGSHGVLWTPNAANDGTSAGTFYSLELTHGLPPGSADTYPTGINDRGQIVGAAYTPGLGDGNQSQSWMWRPSPLNAVNGTTLNAGIGRAVTFPLVSVSSQGSSSERNPHINNNGVIAAYGINYHALLWTPTQKNGTTGDPWTYDSVWCAPPAGINDAGEITGGTCESPTENVPYLHSGVFPFIATDQIVSPLWLQPPASQGIGYSSGLNQHGDMAISAVNASASGVFAYLYKNGSATDLSGGAASNAWAVNNYDQVVGHADTDTRRATLFENGKVLDLNALNDSTNGLFLREAIAINDAGQILASGGYPTAGAAVLLTPNALWIQPVTVSKGVMKIHGTTYSQTITVTNSGTSTIPGTVSVALDGLTTGVTLLHAAGTTAYAGPVGSPYIDISAAALAPGAISPTVTLTFANPAKVQIKYTARIMASPAPR